MVDAAARRAPGRRGADRRGRPRHLERIILIAARARPGCAVALALAACAYDRPPLADLDAAALDATVAVDSGAAPDAAGACAVDADCASGLCQASACVAADQLSYAAPTGLDAGPCTQVAPCRTITRAVASQIAAGRTPRQVVVEPGAYPEALTITNGATVIVGHIGDSRARPTVTASARDAITVAGADLTLRALVVDGDTTGRVDGDGLRCENGRVTLAGVDVTGVGDDGVDLRDCDATLARVSIVGNGGFGVRAQRGGLEIRSSNLQRNAAGGLRSQPVDTLVVTGTVFARNGRAPVGMVGGSSVGGAELLASQSVRFEGNTVADNQSTSAAQRAIVCDDRGVVTVRNNLLTSTTAAATTTCPVAYSMGIGTARPARRGTAG